MSAEERMGLMAQYIDSIKAVKDYQKNSKDFIFYKLFMTIHYRSRITKLIRSLYKESFIMSKDDLLELFEYLYKDLTFRREFNPYYINIKYNPVHELYTVSIQVDNKTTADILLYKHEASFALTVQTELDTGALSSWNVSLKELSSKKPINADIIKSINSIFNEVRAQFLDYMYDDIIYSPPFI